MKTISAILFYIASAVAALAQSPISSPGSYAGGDYYLANSISAVGAVLTFTGPTRLNLNGSTITCSVGGGTRIGIQGSATNNIAIDGGRGSYINDCDIGVNSSTPYTRVQGVIFNNTHYMAASLGGSTSRFYDNTVNGVGGWTSDAYAVGVNLAGDNSEAVGNKFFNLYRQAGVPPSMIGEGCAVIVNASAHNALVESNLISNDNAQVETIGIFAGVGGGHRVQFNQIFNYNIGIQAARNDTILKNTIWSIGGAGTMGIEADVGTSTNNAIGNYYTPITGGTTPVANAVF